MGSPANPTEEQISLLEEAGQLNLATSPVWVKTKNGETTINLALERQAVSLLKLTW